MKEELKEMTNHLFEAAENLREALDTADLKNISLKVIQKAKIERYIVEITSIAQEIKRTR